MWKKYFLTFITVHFPRRDVYRDKDEFGSKKLCDEVDEVLVVVVLHPPEVGQGQ